MLSEASRPEWAGSLIRQSGKRFPPGSPSSSCCFSSVSFEVPRINAMESSELSLLSALARFLHSPRAHEEGASHRNYRRQRAVSHRRVHEPEVGHSQNTFWRAIGSVAHGKTRGA